MLDRVRSLPAALVLAAALVAGAPTQAVGAASLAGVHWYSGDSSMLDLSVPAGERGYNVEVIFDTGWCDGNPATDPGDVRSVAATAKAHGLVNIIRVDYRQMLAVPQASGEYAAWATDFIKCTQELSDLSNLFIVGNEPNIEGNISAAAYASAFNLLYSRKGEMPSGTQLLAAFNSPFTPPAWMADMSSRLGGVDGFALHTGGVRTSCRDPRQACAYGGWSFDGAFRYYRDVIANIHSSWWSRPVYISEFNTYTGDPGSEPDVNYPADWINLAFEEIRSYNATRGTRPAVKALCWFVDRPQSWPRFALRNIGTARGDMGEEFKNPANRGAGGSCPNDSLATPTDRWKLEIWNNKGFVGPTVEQRYDAAGAGGFTFNWGSGRPSNCVGNDNYAVRFSRKAYFATSGSYSFSARTDDGVRLFVDGTNVIDDWRDMPPTDHTATVSLSAGWHDLRMDYYENAGGAVATLSWTGGGTSPANVARNAVGWTASSIYAAPYGGDKAYDGNVSVASKWTSNGATADSWLALDLGRSYDITQFVVKHAGSAGELTGYNTQAFRLESGTSLSGPWTTRATVANTTQANASTVTLPGPVTTRYVRLYITDAGIDNYARIPELEVYGTPSAPPVNHAPKAVATGNPATGPAPLAVAFSGAGSSDPDGDPLSYAWTFGDGSTGSGATVSHTYSARGSYTATLTVKDNHEASNSTTVTITVTNRPPTAVATANPTSGPASLAVAFSGTGSSDPDGDPLSYSWSFGDGTTGSGAAVSHTYSTPGSYTATLTVNDSHGGSNSATVAITVLTAAGTTLVNGDFESGPPGGAVGTGWIAFSSSDYAPTFAVVSDQVHGGSFAQRVTSPQPSSSDKFAGVYQVVATTPGRQYTVRGWNRTHFTGGNAWDHIARLGIDLAGGNDFQAGSVSWYEFDSRKDFWVGCPGCPAGQPLEVSVTATGPYVTIYLESWRKWASGGDSFTWFDDVQVEASGPPGINHAPTARATASPTSGPAPLAVTFSGSGSTDPDGDPLTYSWTFGDGGVGSGVTASHSYASAGTYPASLTVSDGSLTHSAEVSIVVNPPSGNRPPTAVISANPESATVPFTVTLDGSGSSDPDGDPLTYRWQFADGVQGTGLTMQRYFLQLARRSREARRGYLVTLTVTDDAGASGSASLRIKAIPPQGCPDSLDFDALRAQLAAQGQDLEFSKIGFHTGGNGTLTGLGVWERCLDLNGVPFTVKQVPSNANASAAEAAEMRKRSGVPHTAIFRRAQEENGVYYELPACARASASTEWSLCTMDNAEQEAHDHWQRHLLAFRRTSGQQGAHLGGDDQRALEGQQHEEQRGVARQVLLLRPSMHWRPATATPPSAGRRESRSMDLDPRTSLCPRSFSGTGPRCRGSFASRPSTRTGSRSRCTSTTSTSPRFATPTRAAPAASRKCSSAATPTGSRGQPSSSRSSAGPASPECRRS
jgi:PKD repeat protein